MDDRVRALGQGNLLRLHEGLLRLACRNRKDSLDRILRVPHTGDVALPEEAVNQVGSAIIEQLGLSLSPSGVW